MDQESWTCLGLYERNWLRYTDMWGMATGACLSHRYHNALDAAVDALLLAYHATLTPNSKDKQQQTRAYGQALTAMTSRLDVADYKIDLETLCAVLALCTVEAMAGSDSEHFVWLSHAGGSAAMFQASGPQRLKTRFEKSLLYNHATQFVRPLLTVTYEARLNIHQIGFALITDGYCFLDSPEWISIFEEDCDYLGSWDELQAKLVPVYATLPALMRDVKAQTSPNADISCLLEREHGPLDSVFSI